MKIFLATASDVSDKVRDEAIDSFVKKYRGIKNSDFGNDNPDIIWFLTGGSEHNALKQISAQKRYCLLANSDANSWASAIEVKALLNEKGINSRVFDLSNLDTLSPLADYINFLDFEHHTKLGLIGKPADWLVASIPEYDLLHEVLNIDIVEFDQNDLIIAEPDSGESIFSELFLVDRFSTFEDTRLMTAKLSTLIKKNKLDAIALECFGLIKNLDYTPCLSLAALNTAGIPAICEGDLCSAAGMISLFRLNGMIPWMANLIHISSDYATFAHCTAPINLLSNYRVDTHYETCKGAAVRGVLENQQVTVFRLDRKLEYCFLSLGEVIGSDDSDFACRTQAKIKMSTKSLFLLREFPLGNHHLIVPGDQTNILAEYFANKGFRIV